MRIEDKLRENAEYFPSAIAVKCGDRTISYSELYQSICDKAASLNLKNGELVPIIANSTIDFLVSYFAIHLSGAVAVPLDKNLPLETQRELFHIFSGRTVSEDVADILYTTGTTGKSKAVMVSHEAIFAETENLVFAQKFSRDITFIINGPLNHIGSLSKVYPTIYVGGTIHLLNGIKDLNDFFTAIEDAPNKVATFLVPASIRMILTFSKEKLASLADRIDFIETGAAPMPQSDMEVLCKLLPNTRLYNTYASTETGIISTFDFNAGECLAGCLGTPMKHSLFYITDTGVVACKGKTLMTGYWNDPSATNEILRDDTIVTNDIGMIDAKGRLRLQGRNGDVINVGGFKVAPTEVEEVALLYPEVSDCVCISSVHPVMGKVLKLLVVPKKNYIRQDLMNSLKSKLEPHKMPVLYEEVEQVFRTFNGKIDRKRYC